MQMFSIDYMSLPLQASFFFFPAADSVSFLHCDSERFLSKMITDLFLGIPYGSLGADTLVFSQN